MYIAKPFREKHELMETSI